MAKRSKFMDMIHDPLRKNALFLIANNVGISVLGLLFWFVAGWYLSDTDLGLGSAIISVIGLLAALASLGLGMGFIRFLPTMDEKERSSLINSVFIVVGSLAFLLTIVYIIGTPIWTPKLHGVLSAPMMILLVSLFTVFRLLSIFSNSIFISYRASKFVFVKETLIFNLLKLLALPLLAGIGAMGVILSWGLGVTISLIGTVIILGARFSYKLKAPLDIGYIKRILPFSLGNYVTGLLASLPGFILPVIFLNLLNADLTGDFYITWMLGGMLFNAVAAVCMSLFAEGSQSDAKFSADLRKAAAFLMVLVVPALIFIWYFGDWVLSLFPQDFSSESFGLLRLLAISSLPLIPVQLFITMERVAERIRMMVIVQLLISSITIITVYLLVNEHSILSAGYGWLIGHIAAAAMCGIIVLKRRVSR